jgi:hypothetical protein
MAEITYTAKYKHPGPFQRFKKLKNVSGDGLIMEAGIRFFQLLTGEMIYVPIGCEVHFSKEREVAIKSKIREEAGQ